MTSCGILLEQIIFIIKNVGVFALFFSLQVD